MERDRTAAWNDGFGVGAADREGQPTADGGAWAMLAGVWS